jgi:hypothetical protein
MNPVFAQMFEMQRRILVLEHENAELRQELRRVTSAGRVETVPLPPVGVGLLKSLQQSNYIVTITVSSQGDGSVNNLLTEDTSEWYSNNVAGSWIQWRLHGLKAAVHSVKIRGRIGGYGVTSFVIQGSNDGVEWVPIIGSDSSPVTYENWVTQARAVAQAGSADGYSIVRLMQTGLSAGANNNYLVLTYVDFGGNIIHPPTAG